ncbi:hypothetical protein ACFFHT_10695 [Gallibacterium melopsittaci]|uniref:Chalcone isomerase domain-containing protein n=1 Tax=Gallibacterium melopsittaci TaxID=516063 RepID=A0ABV6I1I9_9PAST
MKFFSFCLSLLLLLYTPFSFADWQQVGKAEYNWGPFHIYTVSLFTENGTYSSEQRPLMLRIKFAKPVEGKNFAVSMVKEMALEQMKPEDVDKLRKRLIKNFPDFKPDDVLNYIALDKDGYFVLNDTILAEHFDRTFNHQFISIWLDSESSFKQLQPRLLGEEKDDQTKTELAQKSATLNKVDPTAPTALDTAANEVTAQDNQHLIVKRDLTKLATTLPTTQTENNTTDKQPSSEQNTTVNTTEKNNVENHTSQPVSTEATDKVQTMDTPTTKPESDTTTVSTQSEENKPNTAKSDSTKTEVSTAPTNQPLSQDNDKQGKENTDKKENDKSETETKPDPEQPIEPAIEVDPIMPYQKQYYC